MCIQRTFEKDILLFNKFLIDKVLERVDCDNRGFLSKVRLFPGSLVVVCCEYVSESA